MSSIDFLSKDSKLVVVPGKDSEKGIAIREDAGKVGPFLFDLYDSYIL